jgi:hypothetical protein
MERFVCIVEFLPSWYPYDYETFELSRSGHVFSKAMQRGNRARTRSINGRRGNFNNCPRASRSAVPQFNSRTCNTIVQHAKVCIIQAFKKLSASGLLKR